MTSLEAFAPRFAGKGLATSRRSGSEQRATRALRKLLTKTQNGRCRFCRRMMTEPTGCRLRDLDATVEHRIRRADGGALSVENCDAACRGCNVYRDHAHRGRNGIRYWLVNLWRHLVGWFDVIAKGDSPNA